MSRAFVGEDDGVFDDEDVPEIKIPLPPGARNYVTPEGAVKLAEELSNLSDVVRPRLLEEQRRLASEGDGPEADATAVEVRKLREMKRRIEYLVRMKSLLEVIDPADQDSSRVAFGATVTVLEDGDTRTYRIVGVDESDPDSGALSWISPKAKAMVGAHVGESRSIQLPRGESTLKIMAIEYR